MADSKISELTELTAPAAADELVIVDKSDTSEAASGTDKRIKGQTLLPVHQNFASPPFASAPASSATGATNTHYAVLVAVHGYLTISGVRYRVGSTANGNVRCALYDTSFNRLVDKTSDTAQATANTVQNLSFDSTYVIVPGIYYALLWFSSATATFVGARQLVVVSTGTNVGGTPATLAAGDILNADVPILTLR